MAAPPFSLTLILISISIFLFFSLYSLTNRTRRIIKSQQLQSSPDPLQNQERHQFLQKQQDHLTRLLPAAATPADEEKKDESAGVVAGGGVEESRRKRKGKKKRQGAESEGIGSCPERDQAAADTGKRSSPRCPYPFSSFASATQRKIKAQYDELVQSNQAKKLTMSQVGQFVNCLVGARNELQHKSEIIHRSFKIKKALLVKADRSSFDRLRQQIYKLEAEQKRLEEDAAVYNLLQEQLKLSPAYKTMLEISDKMELKHEQQDQDQDQDQDQLMDFCDISFEDLLAQEKKDSFWQRNGKPRSFAS